MMKILQKPKTKKPKTKASVVDSLFVVFHFVFAFKEKEKRKKGINSKIHLKLNTEEKKERKQEKMNSMAWFNAEGEFILFIFAQQKSLGVGEQ